MMPFHVLKPPMASVSSASSGPGIPVAQEHGCGYHKPFAIMTVLFLMWGFMTVRLS